MMLRFSRTGRRNSSTTLAGTNVTERSIAESSAITTVVAIGWYIFPSTPVSAKIGM